MSRNIRILRFANWALWALVALFAYHIVIFYYPRNILDIVQPVPLEKDEYSIGEPIIGFFEVRNHVNATATYERRMKCVTDDPNIIQEEVIIRLGEVADIPVIKSDTEIRQAQIAPVPVIGFNGVCYMEITGDYKVQLTPFMSRIYQVTYRTADFNVTKGE